MKKIKDFFIPKQYFLSLCFILLLVSPLGMISLPSDGQKNTAFAEEPSNPSLTKIPEFAKNPLLTSNSTSTNPKNPDGSDSEFDDIKNFFTRDQISIEKSVTNPKIPNKHIIALPEELVLQGIEIKPFFKNKTSELPFANKNQIKVKYVDSDGNGLVDKIQGHFPKSLESKFMINATFPSFDKNFNVTNSLENMKNKMPTDFYDKILEKLNYRTAGINQIFPDSRSDNSTSVSESLDPNFQDVVVITERPSIKLPSKDVAASYNDYIESKLQNLSELEKIYESSYGNKETKEIIKNHSEYLSNLSKYYKEIKNSVNDELSINDQLISENKNLFKQTLSSIHNAEDVTTAETLSFVSAKLPIEEIPKLVGNGNAKSLHDGNLKFFPNIENSKNIIQTSSVPFTGVSATVAVIDTGMNQDHVDLPADTVILQAFCDKDGCLTENQDFTDSYPFENNLGGGHGTHVAGIIGGQGNHENSKIGIAPDVKILNVKLKVINPDQIEKNDEFFEGGASAHALDWAVSRGAEVVNMSFSKQNNFCDDELMSKLVDEAVEEGVIVIASAGNSGPNPNTIGSPGCSANSIAVGNMQNSDYTAPNLFEIADSSSRGPADILQSSPIPRLKPDIVAPGSFTISPSNRYPIEPYSNIGGTSAAAPHVSGAAAILKGNHPEYLPLEIKNALILGADWVDGSKPALFPVTTNSYETAVSNHYSLINEWGLGLINVENSNNFSNNGHIIRDTFEQSVPVFEKEYQFTADAGEPVKVFLNWIKHHPGLTIEAVKNSDIDASQSNLDLEISNSLWTYIC